MATLPVELVPLDIPMYVRMRLPFSGLVEEIAVTSNAPVIAVCNLPRETVVELCQQFTNTVLAQYDQHQRNVAIANGSR